MLILLLNLHLDPQKMLMYVSQISNRFGLAGEKT